MLLIGLLDVFCMVSRYYLSIVVRNTREWFLLSQTVDPSLTWRALVLQHFRQKLLQPYLEMPVMCLSLLPSPQYIWEPVCFHYLVLHVAVICAHMWLHVQMCRFSLLDVKLFPKLLSNEHLLGEGNHHFCNCEAVQLSVLRLHSLNCFMGEQKYCVKTLYLDIESLGYEFKSLHSFVY